MKEGKVRMQKPKAEASYGNGYLQEVKLALTHFPTVRNYFSDQLRKGALRNTRYSVGTKLCHIYI